MEHEPPKLELARVLRSDVQELFLARDKALITHHGGDIDAAGDEVEIAVRQVLQKRLPRGFHVGNGFVVDSAYRLSSQLDIVIADRADSPILFETRQGSEYFPYESVYAIGEVKSGYYKNYKPGKPPTPIHAFVEAIKRVKGQLEREPTGADYTYIGKGQGFGMGAGLTMDMPEGENYPFRNPLFSFMIFLSSDKFVWDVDIHDLYATTPAEYLPNVVCLLDKALIVSSRLRQDEDGVNSPQGINAIPEFNEYLYPEFVHEWTATQSNEAEEYMAYAHHLGLLYLVLFEHLSKCVLSWPDMRKYLFNAFDPPRVSGFSRVAT